MSIQKLRNTVILVLLNVFMVVPCFSQETFEEFRRSENAKYQQFQESITSEYQTFYQTEQAAFEKFKQEIEAKWGDFVGSTNREWVEYSADRRVRTIVDFETGEVKLELLISPEEANQESNVRNRLKNAVENLAQSKGKTKDYPSAREKGQQLSDAPLLKGQLQTKSGKSVEPGNLSEYAEEVVTSNRKKQQIVQGKDGNKRVKVIITFPLAPNHIQVRARKYADLVQKFASKYNLPSSLVFAVIHTESYFNPKARSPAPAYGLMQLVPRSGGREAYSFVYQKDRLLTGNYLYQPEKNLELGTAYLCLLKSKYFGKIKNPVSQLYCAIAAYNTGPGNVSRAFSGNRNLQEASAKINVLSPQQVYNRLLRYLPYSETRSYLKKVSKRKSMYADWQKSSEESIL